MKIGQYLKKLTSYTFEWFQKKLINKEELNAVLIHIKDRQNEIKPDRHTLCKRVVTLLYSLGIILILAGVVYFIAANWGGFHKFAKLTIILLGMILFYGAGYVLNKKYPGFLLLHKSLVLIILGILFAGAATIFALRWGVIRKNAQ